ncbi:ABC transporter ATP-binding protein [Timonella sp. A28]|uniref:ABC transporter ATP-binding protein n=1 Tax=Timonella sp. A28 TaxID=3442640 RepID=UPI003EBECB01
MSNELDAQAQSQDEPSTPVQEPPTPQGEDGEPTTAAPEERVPLSDADGERTAIISTTGVMRRFGSFVAVNGATLNVWEGKVTALIGPNGSGKTTLMLMLAGLLAPDEGSIRVCGYDPVTHNYQVRSHIGWMPDQFGMWDSLTALEALTTTGATYRMNPQDALARAHELLSTVHLTDFADKPAHVLSRGQKQRLGLARALMHSPRLLILDEPANGLDPRSRIELRGIIRELAAQGTTILISSHVLAELDEMVDDAIFISGGRTVAQETVDEARQGRKTWQVRALDREPLVKWVDSIQVPFAQNTDGSILVNIAGEHNAARFLSDAITASVPIVEFRPQGGALENTYLALNEERR